MVIDTTRHEKYIHNINLNIPIHIIGCGSIGTAFATTLCRLGFNTMTLWDPDTVEIHNIANQYFDHEDIGKLKVEALKEKLQRINPEGDYIMRSSTYRFPRTGYEESAIFAIGVDSMDARERIMRMLTATNWAPSIIIDMRMGGEHGSIHTYTVWDIPQQLNILPKDEQTALLSCTERTVLYTVSTVASIGAKQLLQTLVDREQRTCYIALGGLSGPDILTLMLPRTASVLGGDGTNGHERS